MLSYILRRLLLMVPTLLGITAVVFFVMALSPGGVGGNLLNSEGEVESAQAQALREYYDRRYGLDQPKAVQYLRWLNRVSPIGFVTEASAEGETLGGFGFKAPDLGESFSKGRPVLDLYGEALPITLLLNAITTPLAYLVAIWTGTYAARYRGKAFDVVSGSGLMALWSVPTIWAGVLLIGFFANAQYPGLHWFPTGGLSSTDAGSMAFLPRWDDAGFARGWLLDRVWHLVLPVVCMTYGSFAVLSKLMRSAVLDNINADFVRTAKAKGLSGRVVLWRHAFRNSLLPLITVAAGLIPSLLAGSLIVEKIFSIPGMGQLMIEAIYARDRELVLAGTLLGGLISLVCILIADLCYVVADPRVSYD
ncbi:MAG: ABC transporter permease [Planctomycetota bacterium]